MNLLFRCCLAVALSITVHENCHAQARPNPSPRMLVEVADLSGVAISPDGLSVAFREERASIERNAHESSWYVADVSEEREPLRVADGGLPLRDSAGIAVNEVPQWSRDSRWLYYRAMIGDQFQVWRASRDGAHAERVTSDPADVEAFWIDPQGRKLIYRVGVPRDQIRRAEEEEYDRGILIDSSIMNMQGLFRSALVDGRLISQRSGRPGWVKQSLLGDAPRQYRSVDLDTLAVRPASDAEIAALTRADDTREDGAVIARNPSPDRNRVAILSGTREVRNVEIRSLSGSSRTVACTPCRELSVVSLAWRNDDELIVTARNVARGYAHSLYSWRISEDALRRIVTSDGLLSGDRSIANSSSCSVADQFAVCVSASSNVPPRLERVDLESGERAVLFDPNVELAHASSAITSELLTWVDPSGREFTGYLFVPAFRHPGTRLPLFVTYYICPGYLRGGSLGDDWPVISLASSGIATLCINAYLPSGQNRDAAADYDIGRVSVETIVDILSNRGLIDRNAVGMGGLSYGTEVTLWTASHSNVLAAASVTSSAATPTWYWFNILREGWTENAMAQWGLGAPTETPERWRQISPAYYPERISAALLMQMPEEEYRMALDYFVPMVQSGAAVEMYAFPHAAHFKFQPRHMLAANQRNLDWFRFWLQGYEDSDPTKGEQYARWREMRERQCQSTEASERFWYCGN